MKEFTHLLSGGLSLSYYLAALFFSGLAILLSLWADSATRDVKSVNTPRKFSVRFLIWDNIKRIIAGLIAMFLVYRFTPSITGRWMEAGVGVGFLVSMGVDQLIGYLKQRLDLLKMDRETILKILNHKGIV